MNNNKEYDAMTENRIKDMYFKAREMAETNPELGFGSIEKALSVILDNYQCSRER